MLIAKALRLTAFTFAILATTLAYAADETNIDRNGIALHGYDPVAYFNDQRPVKGNDVLTAEHKGAVYLFSSVRNRNAFSASPEKYIPAYGGWCSYGVRIGRKFDVDPKAWKISHGRLFMQFDIGIQKIWEMDENKNIEIADRLWPQISSIPSTTLGK